MIARLGRLRESAEEALARSAPDGSDEAGGILAVLDEALLSFLRRLEASALKDSRDSSAWLLRDFAFYRRRLLGRLVRRGSALGPGFLRTLFGGSGSQRLILLVTHACQLRCRYCRVRKYPSRMSVAVAKAGIELLMGSLRKELELQFFGGEPLLVFDCVKQATLFAESLALRKGVRVRFLLTTNGLALSESTLAFMEEHEFRLEFSCDGSPAAQLSQRAAAKGKDYYDRLELSLTMLRKSKIVYQVILVAMPERVERICEEFLYLAGLGHKKIQVNYALGRFWNVEQAEKLEAQLKRVSELAAGLGVEFVNATALRREPVVLNSELTMDCDGGLFRETGICLEEDFKAAKSRFYVAPVQEARLFDSYGATQFDNLWLLARAYGGNNRLRKILLNNLELGMKFRTRQ